MAVLRGTLGLIVRDLTVSLTDIQYVISYGYRYSPLYSPIFGGRKRRRVYSRKQSSKIIFLKKR